MTTRIPYKMQSELMSPSKTPRKVEGKNELWQNTFSFLSKICSKSGISWCGSAWSSLQQPGAAGVNIEPGRISSVETGKTYSVETGEMSSVERRQMSQQQSSVLSQQQTSVLSRQKTSILSQQKMRQLPPAARQRLCLPLRKIDVFC